MAQSRDQLAQFIGGRLHNLRRNRGWSQRDLAEKLGLSQSRLSAIERGRRSLTAEEFLDLLKLFNVPATDFMQAAGATESQLQNALERLGASHLRESSDVLPSEAVKEATSVVREVLIAAESPRQITALAPVLLLHADEINFSELRSDLHDVGHRRRYGWLLANVIEAARWELRKSLPQRWALIYRRGMIVLRGALPSQGGRALRSHPVDVLDRNVRSEESVKQLAATSSPISRDWSIVTALQVEDFVEALRASRDKLFAIVVKQPGLTNPQWTGLTVELQRNYAAVSRHDTAEEARAEVRRLYESGVTTTLGIRDLSDGLHGPVEEV